MSTKLYIAICVSSLTLMTWCSAAKSPNFPILDYEPEFYRIQGAFKELKAFQQMVKENGGRVPPGWSEQQRKSEVDDETRRRLNNPTLEDLMSLVADDTRQEHVNDLHRLVEKEDPEWADRARFHRRV